MFKVPEKYRVTSGPMASDSRYGNNGQFKVKLIKLKRPVLCQASDGAGWEHVSVSLLDRCPSWEEMCKIKALFWSDEDLVVQFHPPKSDYVNNHPHCLHLWRKCGSNTFCSRPAHNLVGL